MEDTWNDIVRILHDSGKYLLECDADLKIGQASEELWGKAGVLHSDSPVNRGIDITEVERTIK